LASGLIWNEGAKRCDWPYNTVCGKEGESTGLFPFQNSVVCNVWDFLDKSNRENYEVIVNFDLLVTSLCLTIRTIGLAACRA
jgi:hypothetical protein